MSGEDVMDDDGTRALARAAALPLPDDRVAGVTTLLNAWLPAANELSRIMSAADHLALLPITVLTHPQPDPTE